MIEASAYMVTQKGAGANMSVDIAATSGSAYVQGDSVTAQGLYYVPPHSAVVNELITAAHATLPRVDAVILEVQDNVHDASGGNLVRTRVVDGTPTAGATLNNARDGSHGGAAIPSNALHLADILVGAAAVSITNSVIRDRRRWARGFYRKITRTQNAAAGSDYTATGTTMAYIDSTNMLPRVECTGNPIRMTLRGTVTLASGNTLYWGPQVDAVGVDGATSIGANASGAGFQIVIVASESIPIFSWEFTPSAGSHLIGPALASAVAWTLRATSVIPCQLVIEEIVRQDTPNNSTTTG